MASPVRSVPPTDGGAGADSAGALWTGEKRLKAAGPPSPPPGLGSSSSDESVLDSPDEVVFSVEDVFDYDDLAPVFKELRWRDCFLSAGCNTRNCLGDEAFEEVYKRFCDLRYKDMKILMRDNHSNPAQLFDEENPWDDPFEPGPSIFGWTVDPQYFYLADLDDYQRILLTRANCDEYPDWEAYRLTFSSYEADQEYVEYCDILSKKIKWLEEYMHRNYQEFENKFKPRSLNQAMTIAKAFPHLTFSLAKRGYYDYIKDLLYNIDMKDYIRVYFEVWERVNEQKMSFEDALRLSLPVCHLSCNHRILNQLDGYHNLVLNEFKECTDNIPRHFADKDIVLEHITNAVYKIKSPERPKLYLDYVNKKLEVARRLQLLPGEKIDNIIMPVTK